VVARQFSGALSTKCLIPKASTPISCPPPNFLSAIGFGCDLVGETDTVGLAASQSYSRDKHKNYQLAAEDNKMFAAFLSKARRQPITRLASLQVEALETRSLQSTLAGLAGPALTAVWPPPPPNQVHIREIVLDGAYHFGSDTMAHTGIAGVEATGARPAGGEICMNQVSSFVTVAHIGEEIPQNR